MQIMNNFYDEYKKRIATIDDYMHFCLSRFSDCESELFDAMNYAVFNGGKRLRSILCMEVCRMLSGDHTKALPFAAAIEFIHAFSLVHDDLPCMDNADLRRGQPSCHKKYGEAMALLAGDALLNTAFEVMTDACMDMNPDKFAAMKAVGNAAGSHGMINGQVRDMALMGKTTASEEELIKLIEHKTMALIMSGAEAGSCVASAADETRKELVEFAYNLGVAFQIRDDFEDEEEDMEEAQNSPNFINSLGRETARQRMNEYVEKATAIIDKYQNNEFIKGLLQYLFNN